MLYTAHTYRYQNIMRTPKKMCVQMACINRIRTPFKYEIDGGVTWRTRAAYNTGIPA